MSSSQEDTLYLSRFVVMARPPYSPSPSSSSGDGEEATLGATAVPYRISAHPITMRSASDSHHTSSPSSSSSDALSGCSGEEPVRTLGAKNPRGVSDDGEGLGLPGDGGDRLQGRTGNNQSGLSKRKRSPAEDEEAATMARKRSRALFDESAQEVEHSLLASSRGKPVARRLGFGGDGNPQTNCSAVEGEGGDRLTKDEFAKFRYVRTGVPPLCYSPPELLKSAHGSPKPPCGGAPLGVPQGMSPVAWDSPDGEVVKRVAIGSPQEGGKGVMGLHRPSPCNRDPAARVRDDGLGTSAGFPGSPSMEAAAETLVQLQNPRHRRTGLGTSSPFEIPEQSEGQQAAEGDPNGDAQSPALLPTKSVPEGEDAEIRRPSDLVNLLLNFSKKPDKRLENVDFLEVLAMKGIHMPPPRWWRLGGYDRPI